MKKTDSAACPCGLPRPYQQCCEPLHLGHQIAADAATLMRSRYSAYVLDKLDYVRLTWHPDTCPHDLEPNPAGLKWLGLQVRNHEVLGADRARVEFVARHKLAGKAHRLHEISEFKLIDGRWYYVDGDFPEK